MASDVTLTGLPAPDGAWPTSTADDAGLDPAAVAAAVALAADRNSTALVIAHVGAGEAGLVAEHYWHCEGGFGDAPMLGPTFLDDGRSIEDVASAQKSVVSVLTGIALGKGLLTLDESVAKYVGGGWSRAGSAAEDVITVRHLLTMTSGLDNFSKVQAAPGSHWEYNLGSGWHTMKRVLSGVAGMGLNDLLRTWLGEPLGMTESAFVDRRTGVDRPTGGAKPEEQPGVMYPNGQAIEGFATSARDLLRFGLAVLAGGRAGDVDLGVPADYLRASLAPSTLLNPGYGFLWWLNGQAFSLQPSGARSEGPLLPAAPADTVAALGALGRAVYVIPSRSLVIVRMGGSPGENVTTSSRFGEELFERLRLR